MITESLAGKAVRAHHVPRVRDLGRYRRRCVTRALEALLRELYPPEPPPPPATYGLSPAELRHHANDLAASGWSVAEICQVLDVEPVGTR
ncbi:MAG TPA: hypothetical protein VGL39_05035 [Jatrophihabitantaceae bacterium]|jgi:hypothetical protein